MIGFGGSYIFVFLGEIDLLLYLLLNANGLCMLDDQMITKALMFDASLAGGIDD